jgi:hypothetical protein
MLTKFSPAAEHLQQVFQFISPHIFMRSPKLPDHPFSLLPVRVLFSACSKRSTGVVISTVGRKVKILDFGFGVHIYPWLHAAASPGSRFSGCACDVKCHLALA